MMPSSVASPVFSWSRATRTPGSELHLVSDVMTVSSKVRFSGGTERTALEIIRVSALPTAQVSEEMCVSSFTISDARTSETAPTREDSPRHVVCPACSIWTFLCTSEAPETSKAASTPADLSQKSSAFTWHESRTSKSLLGVFSIPVTQGKWVQQALFEEPFIMLAQVFKMVCAEAKTQHSKKY